MTYVINVNDDKEKEFQVVVAAMLFEGVVIASHKVDPDLTENMRQDRKLARGKL